MSESKQDKDHAEEAINAEEIKMHIGTVISSVLEEPDSESSIKYDHSKTAGWVSKITEGVMDKCIKLRKPFKYIVNTVIAHKVGGGVHVVSSAHYSATDGVIPVMYEMNDTVFCTVTLYYVAL